jgi:hypothetical protein
MATYQVGQLVWLYKNESDRIKEVGKGPYERPDEQYYHMVGGYWIEEAHLFPTAEEAPEPPPEIPPVVFEYPDDLA